MMFASKTSRDLNHDPQPLAHPTGKRTPAFSYYFEFEPGEGGPDGWIAPAIFDPRPEFDHVQHNAPNPILVLMRKSGTPPAAVLWRIDAILGGAKGDNGVEHARRVLSRLTNLTKDATK